MATPQKSPAPIPDTGIAVAKLAAAAPSSLRERIRLLEEVVENFPGGLALFDSELRMILCNGKLARMLDYPERFLTGPPPGLEDIFRFNAERGEYGAGDIDDLVARRMDRVHRREAHCYDRERPDGTTMEIRGAPLPGGGFVTTYVDVTEQRRAQAQMAHMAHHDALTGLPNRALFEDRLSTALALARRGGFMALHYLDLDRFKPVNDRLGHQAGDELLGQVARRLSHSLRENDTLARLGGDEFAIVQTGIERPEDAFALAARLCDLMERPFRLLDEEVRIGVSIGIALAPDHAVKPEGLVAAADAALYSSKRAGRRCWKVHEPG